MAGPVSDLWNRDAVERIAAEHDFASITDVEKLIVDFEIQRRISQEIDCTVRGGMCIPFHTPGGSISRLSRDIDLMVRAGASDVDAAMERVDDGSPDLRISPVPGTHPLSNLRSYRAEYDSVLGNNDYIRVDFMCNLDVRVPTKTDTMTSLLGQEVSHRAKILTRGALVGDKLTSLAVDGIGINKERQAAVPKQIHDVGTQLRMSGKGDILEALQSFAALTGFKVSKYTHEPPYTVDGTLETIMETLRGLFEIDNGIHLSATHKGRFGTFAGTYLSRTKPYEKSDHITDVLLALFMAVTAGRYLESAQGDQSAGMAARVLQEVSDAGRLHERDTSARRRSELADLPDGLRHHHKSLRRSRLEHLVLLKAIHDPPPV